MNLLHQEAQINLAELGKNTYPGRGLVIGMGDNPDNFFQIYWIMGRSEGSRNRKFVLRDAEDHRPIVAVEKGVSDGATVTPEQAALVFYNAMEEAKRDHQGTTFIVSNGAQTSSVAQWTSFPMNLLQKLNGWRYEPDGPNFTPRITGRISFARDGVQSEIVVLAKSRFGDSCDRSYYEYREFHPGLGHSVRTYESDGGPLPAFRRSPILLPLKGRIHDIADTYWDALDANNRVALAVKQIHRDVGTSTIVFKQRHDR
ncbi:MAG TPA: IMP cyclohydrolase [Candidatus Paceibacterota bacterium]|nr:IMP cyclohydrolase [Candidatus Paceibacterota bacterium]